MSAKVYTFHISYEGLAEKIWRNIAVSSNYRLDQLGYAVLAAFDTMAYHLFEFHYKDMHLFGLIDNLSNCNASFGAVKMYRLW